jgi:tetratricopeptide (TPR) repeat protein
MVMGLVVLATVSTAHAGGEDLEQAKAHFATGVQAYDQGRYDEALKEFGEAHAQSHSPALYFNMAACEEHMDHFQAAALLLNQYLIEKPDAEDRDNVKVRIHALQERDERLHKMTEPPPPVKQTADLQPAPTPPPPRSHLKYTWVMLGVTAAAGAAAIGVGAYTVTHHSDLKNGCGATASGCSPSQVSGLKSTAVATDVLIGVTAAAAVATVAFAIVESRKGHAHAQAGGGARVAFIGNGIRF